MEFKAAISQIFSKAELIRIFFCNESTVRWPDGWDECGPFPSLLPEQSSPTTQRDQKSSVLEGLS